MWKIVFFEEPNMRFLYFSKRLIFVRHKKLYKRCHKVFFLTVIEPEKTKVALPSKFRRQIFFHENYDITDGACKSNTKEPFKDFN